MNIVEAIRVALQSLWVNKLRSVLTTLGRGDRSRSGDRGGDLCGRDRWTTWRRRFSTKGADVFIIGKTSPVETNVDHFLAAEKRKNLVLEDYQAVLEACSHCEDVRAP